MKMFYVELYVPIGSEMFIAFIRFSKAQIASERS